MMKMVFCCSVGVLLSLCVNNPRPLLVSSTNKTYISVSALILLPLFLLDTGVTFKDKYGTLEDYDPSVLKVSILYTNFYDSGAIDQIALQLPFSSSRFVSIWRRAVRCVLLASALTHEGWLYMHQEVMLVLRVAFLCSSDLPVDRPTMRDAVHMLFDVMPKSKADSSHMSFGCCVYKSCMIPSTEVAEASSSSCAY
jgi:hypothetical protein